MMAINIIPMIRENSFEIFIKWFVGECLLFDQLDGFSPMIDREF